MDGTVPSTCSVKPQKILQYEKERAEMPHCDFQRLHQLFKRQYQSHSKASMEAAKLTLTDFH